MPLFIFIQFLTSSILTNSKAKYINESLCLSVIFIIILNEPRSNICKYVCLAYQHRYIFRWMVFFTYFPVHFMLQQNPMQCMDVTAFNFTNHCVSTRICSRIVKWFTYYKMKKWDHFLLLLSISLAFNPFCGVLLQHKCT